MIIMTVNVLTNWRTEFEKWSSKSDYQVKMYDMSYEERGRDIVKGRIAMLQKWFDKGGVVYIGYTLFARLSEGQGIKQNKYKSITTNYI